VIAKPFVTGWRRAAYALEAALLLALMGVFRSLPVDWASAFGGMLARMIGPRLGVAGRALRNLTYAMPENSASRNQEILRGMWSNLGRTVAELPHLSALCAPTSGRIEIVNGDALTDLLTRGGPVMLFGSHLANWEVGSMMIHRLVGPSLLSVYRATNNPYVNRLMRRWLGPRLAVAKGNRGAQDLIRHLRGGGKVGMLVDQKLNDGIPVPFFGHEAMTAPAIARLALRFECPIVPVRLERLDGARFRFTVLPPIRATDTGDTAADVLDTMTRINAMVEGWVAERPEQWLWVHRRWQI
jgi:KDO2-lipid IV(A) lauroyltransferase